MLTGVISVVAENTTANASEDITVPVEGVTTFKYGPAGFEVSHPEEIGNATISEFDDHQLFFFISKDDEKNVLSVDVVTSNLTLDEAVSEWKDVIGNKTDFKLVSEKETTLGEKPAQVIEFTYTEDGEEIKSESIVAVNNGFMYILMNDSGNAVAKDLTDSFTFIDVQEDNISKMVQTKMEKVTAPDKFIGIHTSFMGPGMGFGYVRDFGFGPAPLHMGFFPFGW
jgi:hypothetical protein